MKSSDHATEQLSEAQTCSRFMAVVSAREIPDNRNVQMCVCSVGFDIEGVVAELLNQNVCQQRSRRVYCVVVPENLPPGSVKRLAKAIEWHLHRLEYSTDSAKQKKSNVDDEDAAMAAATAPSSSPSPLRPSIAVVGIEEGTGTKERCAVYQRGAVVLLTSRSLCADLLHRRLAVELVGVAVLLLPHSLLGGGRVQDALAPQTAFCAELLLRSSKLNSAGLTNTERHIPPPIIVLSDAPTLMQSLVQRHHMGAERFVQQLHIGDIQLFPRFRLDFVRHFERLSRWDNPHGRPLEVDRVVAPVSPSVLALDGLLAKIVLETLQELQRLEQQQQQMLQQRAGPGGFLPGSGPPVNNSGDNLFNKSNANCSPGARRAAAAAEADEDIGVQRFLPRARLTATTLNGHLDYSGYPRGGVSGSGGASQVTAGAGVGGGHYVRQSWRVAKDEKGIWFNGISEAAALSIDFSDLDTDLRTVVRRHESQWPFRLLTESLIDVRRLRRATRGTPFSFFLHLESVLEKRLPQHCVCGTGARPPAALWTLSSHFNDVVTVATHRIGTVVYTDLVKQNASKNNSSAVTAGPPAVRTEAPMGAKLVSDTVVVVDSSEEDADEDASGVEITQNTASGAGAGVVAATAVTTQIPQLVPNTEDQETDMEVVVRLVLSWCRTTLRRRAIRKQDSDSSKKTTSNDSEESWQGEGNFALPDKRTTASSSSRVPTLLLLTFGAGAVARYTERLTHDRNTYQQLQLRRFIEIYHAKYGVQLQEYTLTRDGRQEEQRKKGLVKTALDKGEDPAAAVASDVEQQLKTALLETDNPDDAFSDEESNEAAELEAGFTPSATGADVSEESGNDKMRFSGLSRKLLQRRGCASSDVASNVRFSGPSSFSQADPSKLYGDDGGGANAFHKALLSQLPPLPTRQQQPTASILAANKTADERVMERQDETNNKDMFAAAGVSSASVPASSSAAVVTLSVERVCAGAVVLQPFHEGEAGTLNHTQGSAGGIPRVLIFDGSQLTAAELAMLLEGTHEALTFSVPAISTSTGLTTGNDSEADTRRNDKSNSVTAAAAEPRLVVERLVLSRQQLPILRHLEVAQDELPAACLRRLKVQLVTTSLAEVDFKKAVQAEQVAFESLAHTKATLTGTLLVDQSSLRQTEEALESGMQMGQRRGARRKGSQIARLEGLFFDRGTDTNAAAPPCIIFDEREFRSTLPYDLFKRGVDLVPLTLTTADYVLSTDYAVERKSVQDYFQSVMSGRIQHQLAALSRKYAHPMCLIEFHRGIPFRLLQYRIYGRTAKLMANYPRVSFLWARSSAHAAGMLVTLKKTVATTNVDPSDPSLTGSSMDPNSAGEVGGLAASAAEREAAHYAARVLSRFPGITHQNAPRVMQLCGSLIGLATISQVSLAAVMGEENAARLYSFLHTPFHECLD